MLPLFAASPASRPCLPPTMPVEVWPADPVPFDPWPVVPVSLGAEESIAACIAVVSEVSGIPAAEILAPGRGTSRISCARALAIYLAHVGLGLPVARVATGFGRHRTTVTHACARIEERREVAGWDRWVEGLEAKLYAQTSREPGHGA